MTSAAVAARAMPAIRVEAASFIPRSTFPELSSLPRSYFLGHHKAGLDKMKTMVDQIDMIIECRDYRIPLSSRNPLLEEVLQHKHRIVVYTKHDLGCEPADDNNVAIIQTWQLCFPQSETRRRLTATAEFTLRLAHPAMALSNACPLLRCRDGRRSPLHQEAGFASEETCLEQPLSHRPPRPRCRHAQCWKIHLAKFASSHRYEER